MPRVGLQLHEGDDQVLELLFMLSVMTVDHIRRTRYFQPETGRLSSRDNVIKRLRRLRTAGFLRSEDAYDQLRQHTLVFRLGAAALAELNFTNPLLTQTRLYRTAEHSGTQMLHSLMVTECAVRVIESLRGSVPPVVTPRIGPLNLPFYHARVVSDPTKKAALSRFATHMATRLRGEAHTIRPDLTFGLQRGQSTRLFFLEADRGTEGYVPLEKKVRAYHACSRHHLDTSSKEPLWRRLAPNAQDFRVLVVTTTERRMLGIMENLRATPGFDLVRLSTLDQLARRDVVFDEVWARLAEGQVVCDNLVRRKMQSA